MMKFSLVSILLFSGLQAWSFTLGSTNTSLEGWSSPDVTFKLNPTNCPSNLNLEALIDDAAAVWNNLPNSNLNISRGGTSSATTYSSPPVIWCSTNFSADAGGADANFVVGVGTFQTIGNKIVTGQMILNAQSSTGGYIGNRSDTALKIIIAHEMGHVLGLGHSEYSAALMYYNASAKTDFALHQDDADGMAYLYPRNEMSGDKMMGCALVQTTGSGRPPTPPWKTLMILLLPLATWFVLKFKHQKPSVQI